jgi:hypothetical protein
MLTSGAITTGISGWARIAPSPGSAAPVGLVVFSFSKDGVTVSEAGIPGAALASSATIYAQVLRPHGDKESIQTGVAIANPSNTPVTVSLTLLASDGIPAGNLPGSTAGRLTIPANEQRSLFLSEIPGFEFLLSPAIFQGSLLIASQSGQPIAVTGLRGRYNERDDFLITVTPPFPESSSTLQVFPQIVDGGGYSTQFILRGSGANPTLRFFMSSGESMPLQIR